MGQGQVTQKSQDKKQEKQKNNRTQTVCLVSAAPSISHSFTPSMSLLPHPSLIVFTPRYLCFGPQGANTVSIPANQPDTKSDTIFFYSLHPSTLSPACLPTVSHYNFSPTGRALLSLLLPSSSSLCSPAVGTHYLTLLPVFSPLQSLLPPLVGPCTFTSTSVYPFFSLVLLLAYTHFHPLARVFNVILFYSPPLICSLDLFYFTPFFLYLSLCFIFFSLLSLSCCFYCSKMTQSNLKHIHTHSQTALMTCKSKSGFYSLPNTHHHTIKCKSSSNSCYMSMSVPINCVPVYSVLMKNQLHLLLFS